MGRTARRTAPPDTWWARRIAASSTCHHDERGAPSSARGRGRLRTRLPARARLVARAPAGQARGRQGAKDLAHIHHPDVKRMLLTMKETTEAMRALHTGPALLTSRASPPTRRSGAARRRWWTWLSGREGWSTEMASRSPRRHPGHGGNGIHRGNGCAQHLRDARITTIYEGTTGIRRTISWDARWAREGRTAPWLADTTRSCRQLAVSRTRA